MVHAGPCSLRALERPCAVSLWTRVIQRKGYGAPHPLRGSAATSWRRAFGPMTRSGKSSWLVELGGTPRVAPSDIKVCLMARCAQKHGESLFSGHGGHATVGPSSDGLGLSRILRQPHTRRCGVACFSGRLKKACPHTHFVL